MKRIPKLRSNIVQLYLKLSKTYESEGEITKATECLLKAKEEDFPNNISFYEKEAGRLSGYFDDKEFINIEQELETIPLQDKNVYTLQTIKKFLPRLSSNIQYFIYPDQNPELLDQILNIFHEDDEISYQAIHNILSKEPVLAAGLIQNPQFSDMILSDTTVAFIFTPERMITTIDQINNDGDIIEFDHPADEMISIRYTDPDKIIFSKDCIILSYPESCTVQASYFFCSSETIDMEKAFRMFRDLMPNAI